MAGTWDLAIDSINDDQKALVLGPWQLENLWEIRV